MNDRMIPLVGLYREREYLVPRSAGSEFVLLLKAEDDGNYRNPSLDKEDTPTGLYEHLGHSTGLTQIERENHLLVRTDQCLS